MANKILKTRIALRGDTAANWNETNPVLLKNEPGYESDTGKMKFGDGIKHWNELDYLGGDTDATGVAYDNPDYPSVAAALDKLLYVDVSVNALSNNVNTVEMGSTVNSVTLTWNYTGKPTSVTIDNVEVGTEAKTKTYTDLGLTSNKTWTVKASDGKTSGQRSTSVSFLNGVYYGIGEVDEAGVTDAFVQGLTKNLASGRTRDFTVNATAGKYIYYALPARMGTPVFYVGGFEGGFSKIKTFNYNNPSGYQESYDVWKSTNAGLGSTTVTVK